MPLKASHVLIIVLSSKTSGNNGDNMDRYKTLTIHLSKLFQSLLRPLAALIIVVGLGGLAAESNPSPGANNKKASGLTEALGARAKQSAQSKSISPAKKKVMSDAIEELRTSKIVDGVLKVGQPMIPFKLKGADGNYVSSKSMLEKGPLVVVFYRGGWCPYCNLNLRYLEKNLSRIKEAGAGLVAISPETPDESLSTREKNELKFPVLSDPGNEYARKLGLVFKLPKELISVYRDFGIDLEKSNGDNSWELPLAATFIVDADGVVRERFVDEDYKKRMDPEDILRGLKSLKK